MKLALGLSGAALGIVLALFMFVPYSRAGEMLCGPASYYGIESCVKPPPECRTRSGERFTGNDMTAAMVSPKHIGERWRVTYNGKSVVVRINDTGAFAKYGRIADLSHRVAVALGTIRAGAPVVCMERLR